MMLYRNIKTGQIISVESHVCGDWEPVNQQAPVLAEPKAEVKKAPVKRKPKQKRC